MVAALTVDLPWLDRSPMVIDGLEVQRGRVSQLAYDDGIVLNVHVVDPSPHADAESLIDEVERSEGPGRVVLVAGSVPPGWRSALRAAGASFVDVSGVAEIDWPRVQVSARRFGQPIKRARPALPMQKGHGTVAQELLVLAIDGVHPSIGELATGARVSVPTASKAVSQLEAHGLVAKHREGSRVSVEVLDRVELAHRLASGTAWPGTERLSGYLWGRTVFDTAARLSAAADRADFEIAVTGRVGAAYVGVLGTTSPSDVRAWIDVDDRDLADVVESLGLEPTSDDTANVVISSDRWRVGVQRRQQVLFDDLTAWVAHPLRVWCDLHDERRGAEYASQMWSMVNRGR